MIQGVTSPIKSPSLDFNSTDALTEIKQLLECNQQRLKALDEKINWLDEKINWVYKSTVMEEKEWPCCTPTLEFLKKKEAHAVELLKKKEAYAVGEFSSESSLGKIVLKGIYEGNLHVIQQELQNSQVDLSQKFLYDCNGEYWPATAVEHALEALDLETISIDQALEILELLLSRGASLTPSFVKDVLYVEDEKAKQAMMDFTIEHRNAIAPRLDPTVYNDLFYWGSYNVERLNYYTAIGVPIKLAPGIFHVENFLWYSTMEEMRDFLKAVADLGYPLTDGVTQDHEENSCRTLLGWFLRPYTYDKDKDRPFLVEIVQLLIPHFKKSFKWFFINKSITSFEQALNVEDYEYESEDGYKCVDFEGDELAPSKFRLVVENLQTMYPNFFDEVISEME